MGLFVELKRECFQLLVEEWVQNTSTLPLGGLPKNSVVRYLVDDWVHKLQQNRTKNKPINMLLTIFNTLL